MLWRVLLSTGLICSYAECLLATRLLLRWRADVEDAAGVQLDTPTANIIWRRWVPSQCGLWPRPLTPNPIRKQAQHKQTGLSHIINFGKA